MKAPKERNDVIGFLYKDGMTQQKLADKFQITEARVGQILRRQGILKNDRVKGSVQKRGCFLGVWVTAPVKEAIQAEAKNEEKSQSQFIFDTLVAELKRRKVNLLSRINSLEIELSLPLED